ncbi:SDR family oxidoreductase [Aspergillus undulatus]|uniref:SDR family oxidoreductase n=1 Tax=Aspergillus undulatus TaxID=1810928 RepID=UPI003CCC97F6
MGGHALVYGASGIIGWATVNALLNNYPTADAFDRVTALTNRPLSVEDSQWPASEKLTVVSGIDLLKGDQEALDRTVKERVPGAQTVSHVYFCAYIMDPEPEKEIEINVELLKRAVTVAENLSTAFSFVVIPTGVKTYGVHLIDQFPFKDKLPLREALPVIPEPFKSKLFYYPQIELLQQLSAGKPWTFADVIPDIVVGFVPNNNAYCLAQWLALYLSLYREINGEGVEVVFPGNAKSWTIKSNDSSQDLIAKFAIYASLHPEITAGERYNTSDKAEWTTWSVKWPIICQYFGLRGVEPPAQGSGPEPAAYIAQNKDKWFEIEKKYNLKSGTVGNERSLALVPNFLMNQFDFDRQVDLTKTHQAWGEAKEETDVQGAWWTAFDRFRAARIIP